MKGEADVLVIGGGIIGVCSAYYLAERGLSVSILEQGEIASGCSGANAGLIVPSFSIPLAAPGTLRSWFLWAIKPGSPFSMRLRFDPALFHWLRQFQKACASKKMHQGLRVLRDLNYASSKLFERLVSRESLACNFRKDGWLMAYMTEKSFQKATQEAQLLQEHEVEVKVLSSDEALEMEPFLQTKPSGGLFFPEDAHLDPAKFVQALAGRLREQGVDIHLQTEVFNFETAKEKITAVRTDRGKFRAQQFVLTAGAWSSKLVRNLGSRLPVLPSKGYSISVKRPGVCPRIPLYLIEAKVAIVPLEQSLRLAGTMELSGLDLRVNPRRVETIMRQAEDYLKPSENLEIIEIRCGLRPCSPDGLPIIDRCPGYDNLFLATGHGMLGITLAPLTGKLVSQLVSHQTPDFDLASLSATRFS
ncbi:MAG: FAD-dependent oxidoreductase [Candidatus Aminicenantes bacterium]|nr:FAD-dependent oxidoreductase [Candidatus Aminicenantes bacterium]